MDKNLAGSPKLSVITVVWNGMPYIEQTIKSVLNQNYKNLEYIVIDGQSTDGTVDVIRLHEAHLSKWLSEKDDGIADAFNKGIRIATGDYLLFLNSDDALASPNVLTEMVEKIVENQFPSLIYGDCDVVDRLTGNVLYRAVINFSHHNLIRGQMIPHPSLLTSRNYFDVYGSFDPHFKIAMDYEWLLRGGRWERVVHIPLLVTKVRNGGVSTLAQNTVVDEIISALKKNGYVTSRLDEFKILWYFSIRSLVKKILKNLGVYGLFTSLRNTQNH